jgi:L-arabinonolactonase
MPHTINRITGLKHDLGESPVWSAREQAFFWADSLEPAVYRMDWNTRTVTRFGAPSETGSIALGPDGTIDAALRDGFYRLTLASTSWEPLAKPASMATNTRFNDGKRDRSGRFVAGTMDLGECEAKGEVYALHADGAVSVVDTGFVVFNGPCWTVDDKTLFLSDSSSRGVWRFDYDISTGKVSNKRVFLELPQAEGLPDGATISMDGSYWQARNGAGKIVRHSLDGTVLQTIAMPTANITSLAFGGPNMDVLMVTSMNRALPWQDVLDDQAGSVFLVEGLSAIGIPETEGR